jgi:hypothetical protein
VRGAADSQLAVGRRPRSAPRISPDLLRSPQVSLKTRFAFGPMDHAKFMGLIGFSYALSQGIVSKPLIKLFGKDPSKLILLCILVLGGCRPFALWTSSVTVVYMLYVPMVIALGVMNTAITTACSYLADGDQLGGLFGVMESVESIAGMVGPALGGLAAAYHADLPLAAVCTSYAIAFVLVLLFFGKHVVHAPAGASPAAESKKQLYAENQAKTKEAAPTGFSRSQLQMMAGGVLVAVAASWLVATLNEEAPPPPAPCTWDWMTFNCSAGCKMAGLPGQCKHV